MKKLLSLGGLFIALNSLGQNCTGYYLMQNNKTVEMTVYDRKGEPAGKIVYTVSGLVATDTGASTNVTVEQFNKRGKNTLTYHNVMQCKGGTFFMDFKYLTSNTQEKQYEWAKKKGHTSYEYLEYPQQMSIGDHLKDGKFHNDRTNTEGGQLVDINITDRKVEGKESVTTPAGSWDCYKISYKMKIAAQVARDFNTFSTEFVEWYAPGFGVVKSQSKDFGGTELASIH